MYCHPALTFMSSCMEAWTGCPGVIHKAGYDLSVCVTSAVPSDDSDVNPSEAILDPHGNSSKKSKYPKKGGGWGRPVGHMQDLQSGNEGLSLIEIKTNNIFPKPYKLVLSPEPNQDVVCTKHNQTAETILQC